MDNSMPYANFVPEPAAGGFGYDFKENERLKLIIVDTGYTYEYEKEIKLKAKQAENENSAFGDEVAAIQKSHKIGGYSIECVVIGRSGEADKPAMNKIVTRDTPKEQLITIRFQMPTPRVIFAKNKWDYARGMNLGRIKDGVPFISEMYPKIQECEAKIDGSFIPVSKLSEAQRVENDEAREAILEEESRLRNWDALIGYWDRIPEEEALLNLKKSLALWAGIVHKRDVGDEFELVLPEQGTIFEIGISGPRYPSPRAFRYDKEKRRNIFNTSWTIEKNVEQAKVLKERLVDLSEDDMREAEKW